MPQTHKEANIYLIGPRACGKTTVGRLTAQALGRKFLDADQVLVERLGAPVADVVAAHGWSWFRDRESEVLADLAAQKDLVVACGGGVVLAEANRRVLSRGFCVYVQCPAEILAARLMADPLLGQRPSLTGRPLDQGAAQVLAEREPLYLSCAHLIAPGAEPPDQVAAFIAAVLSQSGAVNP